MAIVDIIDALQDWYLKFKEKMGNILSMETQERQPPLSQCVCMPCDDCGLIITIANELIGPQGERTKKRCERCAARVSEVLVAQSPYSRKCVGCQTLFNVSAAIAELPQEVTVNCHRCSDAHRQLIREGAYLEVTLYKSDPRKGDSQIYLCCPKHLASELRRYMQLTKEQGYVAIAEN